VISFYGLPDLRKEGLESTKPPNPTLVRLSMKMGFISDEGYIQPLELARRLLGGLPEELPDMAALMSPVTHVGPHCPPTLLLQGLHDHITPVDDVRVLFQVLRDHGVPVVYHEFPQVEHAFDLCAPRVSPPAQAALHDVERFLALMAARDEQ
jgi:acetyl esterase/lipase